MEWPQDFYDQRAGTSCRMCEQGRPEETPHGVRWPFPFPETDPPPIPDDRLRADVDALPRATR